MRQTTRKGTDRSGTSSVSVTPRRRKPTAGALCVSSPPSDRAIVSALPGKLSELGERYSKRSHSVATFIVLREQQGGELLQQARPVFDEERVSRAALKLEKDLAKPCKPRHELHIAKTRRASRQEAFEDVDLARGRCEPKKKAPQTRAPGVNRVGRKLQLLAMVGVDAPANARGGEQLGEPCALILCEPKGLA